MTIFSVCTVHVTSDTISILHRMIQNSFDGIQFQTSIPLKRKSSAGSRYWGLWLLKHDSMDSGTIGWIALFSIFILFSCSTLSHTCLLLTGAFLYFSSFHGNDFPSLTPLFFFSSHLVIILLPAIIFLRTFSLLFFFSSSLYFISFTFPLILLLFTFITFSYCAFSLSYSLRVPHGVLSFLSQTSWSEPANILCKQVTHTACLLCAHDIQFSALQRPQTRKNITAKKLCDILVRSVYLNQNKDRANEINKSRKDLCFKHDKWSRYENNDGDGTQILKVKEQWTFQKMQRLYREWHHDYDNSKTFSLT